MSICVQDVMVRDVITIDSDYSIKYAARIMNYFSIGSIVVVSAGELIGILTERDVLTRVVAKGLNPEKVRVVEVMSKPVIVVSPTMSLEDAVKIMFQRQIKKLPVIRKKKNGPGLVGMLSLTDVARLQPEMIKTIREVLHTGSRGMEEKISFYVQ